MNYYGDIPKEHLNLLKELRSLEDLIDRNIKDFTSLLLAKGMVCIGFDYYSIHFDEEGDRLLNRAENLCPGYFMGPVHAHMYNDIEYDFLIESMKKSIGFKTMLSLGFKP